MLMINEFSETILTPIQELLPRKLFQYQLSTIKMMENLETRNYGTDIGILSNKAGSGKSLVILGLISRNVNKIVHQPQRRYFNFIPRNCTIDSFSEGVIINCNTMEPHLILHSSLVVCPCIISQWEQELHQTTLKFLIIKSKKDVQNLSIEMIHSVDLVVCTNSMYNSLAKKTENYFWDRVVFDEAESIKSINHSVNSRFFWMMTNDTEKMYNIRKKTFLGKLLKTSTIDIIWASIQCELEFIEKTTSDFKISYVFMECFAQQFFVLRHHQSREVISLLEEKKTVEAVKKMGGDTSTIENLIKTFDEKTTKKITELEKFIEVSKNHYEIPEHTSIVEKLEKEIKSLKIRFDSIKEKVTDVSKETCTICLSEYTDPVMLMCCTNLVCLDCFRGALCEKNNCMFCRKHVTPLDITLLLHENYIPDEVENIQLKNKKDTCIDLIISLMSSDRNEKILLFADHGLSEIKLGLNEKAIYHEELPTGMKDTERTLKRYKGDIYNLNILVLTPKTITSGINLENTTSIIIYNKITKIEESQLIGKAIRASRNPELPLTIYQLYTQNEIN